MKKHLTLIAAVIGLASALARPAAAQLGGYDYSGYYGQLQTGAASARQQWWASLTPRQRQIVQLVDQVEENYRSSYGSYIAATWSNAIAVAQHIGAGNGDLNFIFERLGFWVRYGSTTDQADAWMRYAQGLLGWK